jgi:uncharacterized protein (DUF2147 family)
MCGVLRFAVTIFLVLAVVQGAHAASPADGLWQAGSGGGVIEIHDCGDALCGRVIDSTDLRANPDLRDDANHEPSLRSRLVKGLDILLGFKGGPKEWTGGRIYDPANGHTYHANLKLLAPDRLKVTGCLILPLCGAQVWRKIN